jgi:hypothetical protein
LSGISAKTFETVYIHRFLPGYDPAPATTLRVHRHAAQKNTEHTAAEDKIKA